MKKLLLILFLVTFSFKPMAFELIDFQDPIENEQREFYIGDKIFISTSGYIKPCIVPLREFKRQKKQLKVIQTVTYKKNVPVCKDTINSKLYSPNYINYVSEGGISTPARLKLDVRIREKKTGLEMCMKFMGFNTYCFKGLTKEELKVENEYFVHSPEYSVKSISFLGKSRGLLKFTYEEVFDSFYNPLLRTYLGGDSQTLQFEVDPSESKIFSFKGALFEIVKESSSSINIKVIKGFPAN